MLIVRLVSAGESVCPRPISKPQSANLTANNLAGTSGWLGPELRN